MGYPTMRRMTSPFTVIFIFCFAFTMYAEKKRLRRSSRTSVRNVSLLELKSASVLSAFSTTLMMHKK